MTSTSPSVVDFFSGCGGTSQGFRDAGLSIAAGLDSDADAAESYRANFPEAAFIEKDIRKVRVEDVTSLLPTGPLLFAGCAPCQPFSRQNKSRNEGDPRRGLLTEFGRFVVAIRPEFVVIENVPGMQRLDAGGPLRRFTKSISDVGYRVDVGVMRSVEFGVPQMRRRLVLVAARNKDAVLPAPTHGHDRMPPTTVRSAIEALPVLGSGDTDPHDLDHAAMRLSPMNLQRIALTPEGGDRRDWPDEFQLECHKGHSGHTDVYGRMWWDRPASGLTTRCVSYSNGRFGHPDQDRAISLREAALLQTFPATFAFTGTLTSRARQVGNAVPPLMARRIAESLVD